MKRLVNMLVVLSLTTFACSLMPTLTPTQPEVPMDNPTVTIPPPVTEPPLATEPPAVTETQAPTEPTAPLTNLTCHELSLYLNPSLASSTTCEIIPAQNDGIEIYPQYTKLTLNGYPLADKFFPATISVFSVAEFTALFPDLVPARVAEIQAIFSAGLPGTDDELPFMPFWNAAQIFHAWEQPVSFVNGNGISFLTLFAQYYAPVNNHDLFYTYQGLTEDGQYWVSAVLPINHPLLPANADNPPDGMSWEQFSNNYATYLAEMIPLLENQDVYSFTPGIPDLDALVASMVIIP